ncbi:MAG: glycosyltransferase [Planctomycetes bacterium]|nr:glycosyltransferase [Planctomycetota bacterium]
MHHLQTFLAALAALSACYWIVAAWVTLRARRAGHTACAPRPAVSLLIPVAGAEPGLRENLRAALAALEPGDELLVGAALPRDHALDVARAALGDDPRATVVADATGEGTNRKVLALEALERRARHDVLVLIDSDVRLERATLDALVAPLVDTPATHLSTALYRVDHAGGAGARLEAATVHGEFVLNVAVARALAGELRFALGAANALRREALRGIGGFRAFAEHLADDHELGRRLAAAGGRVALAPCVVPIVHASRLRETVARLRRWARTYRACRPWGYLGTGLTHHGVAAAFALALLAWSPWALGVLLGVLAVRTTAAAAGHALVGARFGLREALVVPARDLLGTALFVLAWTGSTVRWRGREFVVERDGRLRPLEPHPDRRRALTQETPP